MLARFSSAGEAGVNNTIKAKGDQNKKQTLRPGKQGRKVKVGNKTIPNEKNKPGIKQTPIPVNEAEILEEVIVEDRQEDMNATKVTKKMLAKAEK